MLVAQSRRLTSKMAELPASLVIPGSGTAAQLALGRHPTIPPGAVPNPLLPGTSVFTPPQPAGPSPVRWVFNDTTGVIVQRCETSCGAAIFGRLLAGYIAFSTGSVQPSPAQAESPSSSAMNSVSIEIADQTLPNPLNPLLQSPASQCFVETQANVRAYYCMIQVLSTDNYQWSAQSRLTGLSLAGSINDDDDDEFRVCRYTPHRNNNAVGTGSPAITNDDHPYRYSQVDGNLVNQNFLVIRAGDDDNAFDCPSDLVPPSPALNLINSNTWHHQPST